MNYRLKQSDASTYDLDVASISGGASTSTTLGQPPGASKAFLSGTGKPAGTLMIVTVSLDETTDTLARLAASEVYAFALDAVILERVDTGVVTAWRDLPGGGLACAWKRVRAPLRNEAAFEVDLALRPVGPWWNYPTLLIDGDALLVSIGGGGTEAVLIGAP